MNFKFISKYFNDFADSTTLLAFLKKKINFSFPLANRQALFTSQQLGKFLKNHIYNNMFFDWRYLLMPTDRVYVTVVCPIRIGTRREYGAIASHRVSQCGTKRATTERLPSRRLACRGSANIASMC